MTLGLCMIVKNEEQVLGRALSTAHVFADEIVIVDTGSTDGTVAVAKNFTDRVYGFSWCDDFAAARNYAVSKVSCDYWMWLDADDVVPIETARKIAALKKKPLDADIVMLPYVLETDSSGKPTFSYYRERIIRNSPEYVWSGRVHEAVALKGKILRAPYMIRHLKPPERSSGSRNLGIYERMVARGEPLCARERYYYARELFYNGETARAAKEFETFVEMPDGYVPNKLDAYVMLSRCYERLGQRKKAYTPLLKSFELGLPTGECCCDLGLLFFSDGRYGEAAYWFERAAHAKPDLDSGAFVDADYYGFLPYVWLTVCYDRLGDRRAAYKWHLKAQKLKPEHPSVVANRAYFESIGKR